MLDADGVAVLRGAELLVGGSAPRETDIRDLAAWIGEPIEASRK